MLPLRDALAALLVGLAASIVVVALAIVPFLNPLWVGFDQDRADVPAWTGLPAAEVHRVTDAILHDLILGPPDFAVERAGAPYLNDREREHMRDVRTVFASFYAVAAAAAVVLVGAFLLSNGRPGRRAALWRVLARAGRVIVLVTAVGGVLGLLFFDAAFELFHQLFFSPGSYLFDPLTDHLVQLFPQAFWIETTIGVGLVVVLLGLGLAGLASFRSRVIGWTGSRRGTAATAPARLIR